MSWRRPYGSISPGRVKMWYFNLFSSAVTERSRSCIRSSDWCTCAGNKRLKREEGTSRNDLRPMSSCQCQCQCQWGMGKVLHQTDALVQEMKGWKGRRVTRWITDLGFRSYITQTCTLSRLSSIFIKTNNQTRRTHVNEGRCKGKKRR